MLFICYIIQLLLLLDILTTEDLNLVAGENNLDYYQQEESFDLELSHKRIRDEYDHHRAVKRRLLRFFLSMQPKEKHSSIGILGANFSMENLSVLMLPTLKLLKDLNRYFQHKI